MTDYLSTTWTYLTGTEGSDSAVDFEIDIDESIYLTGTTQGNIDGQINSFGDEAFISKLDREGNNLWTKLMGTYTNEHPKDIELGQDGYIYITGNVSGDLDDQINNGDRDAFNNIVNRKNVINRGF